MNVLLSLCFWSCSPSSCSLCHLSLQGYDNTESSVRKASVFCLVAIYSVIGEDLKPHLALLTGSKVQRSDPHTHTHTNSHTDTHTHSHTHTHTHREVWCS